MEWLRPSQMRGGHRHCYVGTGLQVLVAPFWSTSGNQFATSRLSNNNSLSHNPISSAPSKT